MKMELVPIVCTVSVCACHPSCSGHEHHIDRHEHYCKFFVQTLLLDPLKTQRVLWIRQAEGLGDGFGLLMLAEVNGQTSRPFFDSRNGHAAICCARAEGSHKAS